MILYSVHRITFQHALSSYQYLKRTRNNFVTDNQQSQSIIYGVGQDGPAPTLEGRLSPHAHYLKDDGIWKTYVMSLNLNYRRY